MLSEVGGGLNAATAPQSASEVQKYFQHHGSANIGVLNETNNLTFLNHLQINMKAATILFYVPVPKKAP